MFGTGQLPGCCQPVVSLYSSLLILIVASLLRTYSAKVSLPFD